MSRKVKSISFNTNDPFEKEIYKHILQYPNFSKYVKRLIEQSISGEVWQDKSPIETVKDKPVIDKNYISQIL